tara:strand:+ start:147 stop:554 length:408 start_codon:yes stop_codon:yes gene_type:complete
MACKFCGANSESEFCFRHKPKKKLANNRNLKKAIFTVKSIVKVAKPIENINHLLFKEIWKERIHKSEVSGKYLGKEAYSTYFHHILPKSKYPEIKMDKENIILLTADEHANVESDMYRYDLINKKRKYLIEKYYL